MENMPNDRQSFFTEVYAVVKQIPYGTVTTYGTIAAWCGRPQCSRMVGQALHNVPATQSVPCHRVVNASGRLAPGWAEQQSLLADEGITFMRSGCVNMTKHRWSPAE